MNISYKWLLEYVDCDLNAYEVADALTSVGLEVDGVEEIQSIKGGLKGLVVGHVLTCEPHPNSDHMHICTVDLGQGEPVQIVCGAHNVEAGQKVIVATLGTVLYDGDNSFVIKRSKLRGVESLGMICAEDEIGVGNSHDGIIVLPTDTPAGMPAATYYQLESDYLIEVDITANRVDGCSHYGVARDLHAWLLRNGYKTALKKYDVSEFKADSNNLNIDVEITNAEACPRFCAVTLKNCEIKESPQWLKDKLAVIGLHSINNIVDITNYVMMAYGQPLHCYDADMIIGNKVIVKPASEGESFMTLDGNTHKLSAYDLMICNEQEPMCIAGVLGGKGSGTTDSTHDVLLESAYFNPTWIRKSARRHGLSTDASFRFERGVDPNGQIYALKVAAMMAKELSGCEISMDIKDIESGTLEKWFVIDLDYKYVHDLVGQAIPVEEIKSIVKSLEMQIVSETPEGLHLKVPAYRVDVKRPCDVVEDILRIYGYNNIEIPTSVKSSLTIKGSTDYSNKLENLISEQLVGMGFNEILNNSLTKEAYYQKLESYNANGLVHLINPLSSDLNVMRQTLLFGGLESIAHNANRRITNLRFFEFGNCYKFDENKRTELHTLSPYRETLMLGLWLTGKRVEGTWAHPDELSSVHELKAYVMNILLRLGCSTKGLIIKDGENDVFAKSLAITDRNNKILLELGIVKKEVTVALDVNQEVYYAEMNWSHLMKLVSKNVVSYKELSKYPTVSRDLALLVDKEVTFAEIEKIAFASEKKLLKKVELFDIYEGKNLEAGKKSYAVNFVIGDDEKTMNDKQTEAVMKKIIANLMKQLNAKLR